MELSGKAALITGGARIGLAVAEALAVCGCHLVLTYHRSKDLLEAAAKTLRTRGVRCLLAPVDVRKPPELNGLIHFVEGGLGRLDVLVNMASVYDKAQAEDPETAPPGTNAAGDSSWRDSMDVDAGSAYRLSLDAAPLMRRGGGGRVINFSDWLPASGRPRYRDYPGYYVAKSAVKGVTEMLALELAPDILVNAVAPGPILPPKGMREAERKDVIRETPLRRWGGPDEVARTVVFLAQTDFITGECVRVDGGRHLY